MKKFLSIILTLTLVMTMLVIPVSAANVEWTVDITSISEGEVFTVGEDILLTADATTLADSVKNIDFYANGSKIPGTVVGNEGSITWYAPCEGVYDISTKVTFSGDNETVNGNETVRIIVLPSTDETRILWAGETDLQVGSKSSTTSSNKYALFGSKTASWTITSDSVLTIKFTPSETVIPDWTRTAVVYYLDGVVDSDATIAAKAYYYEKDGTTLKDKGLSGSQPSLSRGYNFYSLQAIPNGSSLVSIDIPLKNLNGVTVYVCGIIGMKSRTDTVPVATPSIVNNATGICNEIGTYRINFDASIIPDQTKNPVNVKLDGENVSGITYTYGFDYVDINLPTLGYGKTYTVSVLENTIRAFDGVVSNQYTAKYVAPATFTFTTKDTTCESATPIVKMSYPASNATVMGNTGFAAQVLSPSSAISTVEFYNGETKIEGTATRMNNGEWWFEPETDLDAGTYNISAKFLDASAGVLAQTVASTYTVVAVPKHYLKGIHNGAVIVAAEEASRKITVVDDVNANKVSTEATNIEKVEFYDGDVLLDTDLDKPYEYNLVFDNYGDHTFTAKVYDAYGNITPYTSTYKVVNATENKTHSFSETFDTATTDEETIKKFFKSVSGSNRTFTYADGVLNFSTDKERQFAFKSVNPGYGTKVHYYEYTVNPNGTGSAYELNLGNKFGGELYQLLTADDLLANQSNKIGLILDFNANVITVRLNGEEFKRVTLTETSGLFTETDEIYLNNLSNKSSFTIDNFEFSVYDNDNRVAFGTGEFIREFSVASGETTKTISVKAINTTNIPETVTVIVAAYENDEKLIEVLVLDKDVEFKAGDFKTYTYKDLPIPEETQTVRVFMWSDMETITPIGSWAE